MSCVVVVSITCIALINHTSQSAEESLANIHTSSCARLSMKIVDNQLDAWLRFSVSPCEYVQV